MGKKIKNSRNGYHFNSTYWQTYKKALPDVPAECIEIAIGMTLGDATIARVSHQAYMKFEQGYKQKLFLYHLFEQFKIYCFMQKPGIRYEKTNAKKIKSYWFKTFSHKSFTIIFDLFYKKTDQGYKKCIHPNLIHEWLTPRAFAYWVMCDGSLQGDKKTLILHTQGFTLVENQLLSSELNAKFGFHSSVIRHKTHYSVIEIPSKDSSRVKRLLTPYMEEYFDYKVPGKTGSPERPGKRVQSE